MQKKIVDPSSLYRQIITDAWRIAWGHKFLWLFGFFTALVGFGGVSEVFFNAYERTADWLPAMMSGSPVGTHIPGYTTIRAIIAFSSYPTFALMIFIGVSMLVFAVFAWMTMVSVGALIGCTKKIEKGGEPKFSDGVRVGAENFWTVFLINLILKLGVYVAFIITSANLYILMKERTLASSLFYLGSFILFTALAVAASLITVYATNYAVLKQEPLEKAMTSGWRLLGEHWLVSLEMTAILFVLGLALAVGAIVGTLVLSVPIIFLIAVVAALQVQGAALALIAVTAILLLVVIIGLASFFTALQTAAWTLLWSALTEKKPVSKLLRLFHRG